MYNSITTTFWGKGKEQTEDLVNQFQKIVIIQEKDFHKDPDIFSAERRAEWETLWESLIPNKEVLTAVYEDIGWNLLMQNQDLSDINYLKVGSVKLISSKDFAPFEIYTSSEDLAPFEIYTCQVKIVSMFIDFYSMLRHACKHSNWCSVNIQKFGFHAAITTSVNFSHDVVQMPENSFEDGEDISSNVWMLNNPNAHSENIEIPLPVNALQDTIKNLNIHSVGFVATAPADWKETEAEKERKRKEMINTEQEIIDLANELYPSDETKTLINELFSKYNLDTKH